MLLRARHYATGECVDVRHDAGTIVSIAPAGESPADREAGWVAPALFDLQINGCHGISFNAPTLTTEQVARVVAECRRHGVAGLLPTLVTNAFDALAHGFRTLGQAVDGDPATAAAVPGFHLEGPYISGDDGPRGAHPKAHVRDPDADEFRRWQDAAGGRIRLVTLAPERPGALRLIEDLAKSGVVVAIGHTAATAAHVRDAIAAGARLSTHLGNGSHAVLPRHDNYIWEQLAADELWASIIPDGHHLPAAVVKSIVRVKTPRRTILTCDASSLAGLPPGRYSEWGTELEVRPGGKVVVPGTPFLAGSGVFTDVCVGTVMRQAGVTLADAIDMACARPRELLRLPPWELVAGARTPLVLFDWEAGGMLEVRDVVS
ncbi:MAG TPA: N-acetylglucosamine-6-phosphate deacetylase [Gemmataceae bacterium]|nr:N-acetylglucosamine-6-phosphate deacetylase [Gemmataceae bacterium]